MMLKDELPCQAYFKPETPCNTTYIANQFNACEDYMLIRNNTQQLSRFGKYYRINLWLSFIGGSISVLVACAVLIKCWQGKRFKSIFCITLLLLIDSLAVVGSAICERLQFSSGEVLGGRPLDFK
jgi:hypothetical protein